MKSYVLGHLLTISEHSPELFRGIAAQHPSLVFVGNEEGLFRVIHGALVQFVYVLADQRF